MCVFPFFLWPHPWILNLLSEAGDWIPRLHRGYVGYLTCWTTTRTPRLVVFCWEHLMPVYLAGTSMCLVCVLRKAGSNPVGLPLVKNRPLWELLLWLSGLRTWQSICEDVGSIPGLTQWIKDLALPLAVAWPAATALTRPLTWKIPYAAGVAMKRKKKGPLCMENKLMVTKGENTGEGGINQEFGD